MCILVTQNVYLTINDNLDSLKHGRKHPTVCEDELIADKRPSDQCMHIRIYLLLLCCYILQIPQGHPHLSLFLLCTLVFAKNKFVVLSAQSLSEKC